MTPFGLDDVRDSYTADMTRFLETVEVGARRAIAAAESIAPAYRAAAPAVDQMVVGLHGIAGSSSLIALETMASAARRLEDVAALAGESQRIVALHLERLHRIAAVCIEGSGELRGILRDELSGDRPRAEQRAAALVARLASAPDAGEPAKAGAPTVVRGEASASAPRPAIPPLPPLPRPRSTRGAPAGAAAAQAIPLPSTTDDGWGDADAAPAPTSASLAAAEDDLAAEAELAAVFEGEAREALTALRGYTERLVADPRDREAIAQCARLIHLLKGAAATVGHDAAHTATRALHARAEQLRAQGVTAAGARELAAGIEALIDALVPGLRAAPAPAGAGPGADPQEHAAADAEARAVFAAEAGAALAQARGLVTELVGQAGDARGVAASRLERVLHRLKGSALIVGIEAVAAIATRGQALCEELERVDPVALGAVLAELDAHLGEAVPVAAQAARTVAVALPPREEWDVYLEESGDLLEQLDRATRGLAGPARREALADALRLYHTLKGATNAIGLAPLGQRLHLIETHVERLAEVGDGLDGRALAAALGDENAEIRADIARASRVGAIELDLERTRARLAAQGEGRDASVGSWIVASDPVWAPGTAGLDAETSGAGAEPSSTGLAAADSATPADGRGRDRRGRGDARPTDDRGAADLRAYERRFVRVAADRLDGLLDLVGELVVCRSRMLVRVGRMAALHGEDQARHDAVVGLVDAFASSTQFANLDGRRRRSLRSAAGSGPLGFGALELDEYEEIHVLSRRLDEAASDVAEVRRDLGAEMLRLAEDAESLSSIVEGLQGEITRARMLTLETLFGRLELPIRDAAARAGRDVALVTAGEDVAIDKSISDALFGPLLHLVRNAVAHGIEPAPARATAGKPATGTIRIEARQEHGQIVLEISDDGGGIDVEALHRAGVAHGAIDAGVPPADPRVLELVFAHGVSTSREVDDVAGRGVGGDVVRRAIDRLNGSIQITTARGVGTTFRIALPVSISITQAVLFRAAGTLLAIPIAFAQSILRRDEIAVADSFGRQRMRLDDQMIPLHPIAHLFEPGASSPRDAAVIICAVGADRIAIEADAIVGQEEVVVKSLGALLDGHALFAGCTLRGDNELALIIDVPGVLAHEGQGDVRGVLAPVAAVPVGATELATAESALAPTTAGERALPEAGVMPMAIARRRVLFVDDSLSVRKVAERMLARLDVEVVTAVDGLDALDKLRAMPVSLVFTDLEMPRLHGYDLIREMQIQPAYRPIPVVVISSRSGQRHIDQALAMGAREYLTKPFTPEVLQDAIERLALSALEERLLS